MSDTKHVDKSFQRIHTNVTQYRNHVYRGKEWDSLIGDSLVGISKASRLIGILESKATLTSDSPVFVPQRAQINSRTHTLGGGAKLFVSKQLANYQQECPSTSWSAAASTSNNFTIVDAMNEQRLGSFYSHTGGVMSMD